MREHVVAYSSEACGSMLQLIAQSMCEHVSACDVIRSMRVCHMLGLVVAKVSQIIVSCHGVKIRLWFLAKFL